MITKQWMDLRDPCYVYFARPVNGGLIKIGSSWQPEHRLKVMQSNCPMILEIFALIPGGAEVEYELHQRFTSLRQHSEWFTPDPDLMDYIAQHAEPVSLRVIDRRPGRPLSRHSARRKAGGCLDVQTAEVASTVIV